VSKYFTLKTTNKLFSYFVYVIGDNEEIYAGHLAKFMIKFMPIDKKNLIADQVYVQENTTITALFGVSSAAIMSPYEFAVKLLDTYCPKGIIL
jgi:hypothetical protein